nr:PREDICTED: uncharacterized protein LOC103373134 [Stegastes partitus]
MVPIIYNADEAGGFPNFTSEAGSPFFFRLPIPAGHTQLSLADGDSTLPHWIVFRQQTSSLAGLALTEDCGIYHLEVSITGERCTAHFYLHILNRTVTDKNPQRDSLSCSGGQMTTWATLLLQLNPTTLDANQRIHLVSTMADYLRLLLSFVSLFSQRKPFTLKQDKLRVCRQGGLAEKRDAIGDVAEIVWPVGCQEEERQVDVAKVLEHTGHNRLNLETFTTPHSIYPSLPLTRASHSVTSTLTHEAADRDSLATRLTLRPPQKETPFWTESWTADRTESESQSSVTLSITKGLLKTTALPNQRPLNSHLFPIHFVRRVTMPSC